MACKNVDKLWNEYFENELPELKERLIEEYIYLVKYIAGRVNMYLGQVVEYDDLVGYGNFGLLDAIDKYDLTKGVKFETYASLRIRGAMIDSIRKNDWVPRSLRQRQKKLEKAITELENELGRPATDKEVADKLEVSLQEYHKILNKSSVTSLVSLEEYTLQNQGNLINTNKTKFGDEPQKVIEYNELIEILGDNIDNLPEKEKTVITLYYYEELTLKEISLVLGVSESRISQLHSKAILRLKSKLKREYN